MKLLDKIHSKVDKTVKFVFRMEDDLISEVSYIDNNTGKDIVCVNTHTGCDLGCRFCHTTDCQGKVKVRPLWAKEIYKQVQFIREDLKLKDRMLLVSYMGCGEPLLNIDGLIGSMLLIYQNVRPSRFGLATLIPAFAWHNFFRLIKEVQLHHLPLKIHLSLHFVDEELRHEYMPAALAIRSSLAALEFYQELTKNSVEVHYTLIDGVNDSEKDANRLSWLVDHASNMPVKLLTYNERKTTPDKASRAVKAFAAVLEENEIPVELYDPPGRDVGSSCGSFLMDYYLKYNSI